MYGNGGGTIWDYFCNHRCLMDFVSKHTQAMINIEPRTEPLETSVEVKKETHESTYWGKQIRTTITAVDNA